MSEKEQQKTKYRVRNWSEYNQALVKRGSLTLWLSEDVTESWLNTQKSGKRGRSNTYADVAVECMQLIRNVFSLPLRQTQGFVMSIMKLIYAGTSAAMKNPAPTKASIITRSL